MEEGRRRGGSRWGGVTALLLAALLIVALVCLGMAGYAYLQARETVANLNDRVADLAGRAPLRETVVVRPSGPAVVRQIQQLSRLETSRYTIERVLDAERSRRYVPEFLAGETLIFIAHGEVVAGLDLSKLEADDIRISGDSVTLDLPDPDILYSRLDNEKSRVYSRDTGLFSDPDKDLEGRVRADAEEMIRQAALEDGILEEARASGERTLQALLNSLGYTQVEFR